MSENGSSGSSGGDKGGGRGPEDDAALSDRLRTLGRKLEEIEAEKAQSVKAEGSNSAGMQGMGFAFRVAAEFMAGILVGAGLGWLIDRWLGTSPWGMILLLMLGFAAGVLNVLRVVGKVAQPEDRLKGRSDGRS